MRNGAPKCGRMSRELLTLAVDRSRGATHEDVSARALPLDLTYDSVQQLVEPYLGSFHEPSPMTSCHGSVRMSTVLEQENTQAEDCVCDGPDDKGVDGIYVDNQNNRLDVFQAKCPGPQLDSRTVVDTTLKDLAGDIAQFIFALSKPSKPCKNQLAMQNSRAVWKMVMLQQPG